MKYIIKPFFLLLMSISIACFYSCNSDGSQSDADGELDKNAQDALDSSETKLIKFNDVVFSIPSPYQFAFFIKGLGISYNKEYLNSSKSVRNYTSSFKQGINMGIYGTDLGYLNIYEQVPDAVEYFATLKVLSQDVGISNTFDATTLERIERNMGNKDSLLYILSNKYREADASLKDNDRNSIAVLILAGGWIESLYIMVEIAKETNRAEVVQKIAEQKHSLENLIKILAPFNSISADYKFLIDKLIDIAYIYDGVSYHYEFKEPTVEPQNKLNNCKQRF
ncbi:MAG: hypothetical protein IPO21_14325 [Bacteroidales bacterium]|nr:hypothetical protein [Bacteroidales bacterium]